MKKFEISFVVVSQLLFLSGYAFAEQSNLPPPPKPPLEVFPTKSHHKTSTAHVRQNIVKPKDKSKSPPFKEVPHGENLVSIDFPNGIEINDIIKTISAWTGKNFLLGQGVAGNTRISIVSSEPVTKEEAYQAFLSALNISGFTTVEAGRITKILPVVNARNSEIKTYYGESWAPSTDEIINQVVPLKFIDVNTLVGQIRPLLGMTQNVPFTATNSLILTDTGNRIRRILEVIRILDNKVSQSQVYITAVNYVDAQDVAKKVVDIFGSSASANSISLQKALVDGRTNSLILVGPSAVLDDIVRFVRRLDKPTEDLASQTMIRVRPLDYADAEKLAQTLQALSQNSQSRQSPPPFIPRNNFLPGAQKPDSVGPSSAELSGSKIAADKSTNSLIIEGSKAAFNALDSIVSQLDKRRAQVYIEANIIDLNISNDLDWQPSTLGGATTQNGLTLPFGFNAQNTLSVVANQAGTTSTAASAFGSLGNNAILGILSNTTVNIGGFSLTPGALIFALKSDSNTNVLQTPSMMVSDNETANFKYAAEWNTAIQVANPNGSGGTVTQTQKYDVTTGLKITPQISRSDYVNLKINLQLDDAGVFNQVTGYPNPIYKRSAESVVTVQNEQTAVLGGITQNSVKNAESKVPLLGDIPILGWLFKKVVSTKQKTNLMLLITPHVVRNAEDLSHIYEKKIKDRDDFLKAFYGKSFRENEFYSLMPKKENGQARPERITNDLLSNPGKNDLKSQEKKSLPSEENNPINAPTGLTNGLSQQPPTLPK